MKNAIISVIFMTILIATAPLIALVVGDDTNEIKQSSATTTHNEKATTKASGNNDLSDNKTKNETSSSTQNSDTDKKNDYTFRIYDKATKKIISVGDFDFCCGALATEIEPDIPKEAIKAQAVAIHTYYSYIRSKSRAENKDYDFECNTKIWETYVSQDELKEKWGETFDDSYKAIRDAVDDVSNIFVIYDNSLCMTKYFEISSGNTNSYKEIYGTDIPYLVSTPSPFDTVANNYKTKKELTISEVDNAIKSKFSNYKPNNDVNKNISNIVKNDYGTVLSLTLGNIELTGKEIADILKLRSNAFEVTISNDSYIFVTYGYGENIGMSQFGACKMAEQGNSYIEILQYYYPNTEISENYKPI